MPTTLTKHVLTIFLILCLAGCQSFTGPSSSTGDYSPLNVGDMLQLVNSADSSTQFFTVLGNVKRQDGTIVFAIVRKIGTLFPADTLYRFFRDGYLISTLMDSSTRNALPGNPFAEARIAKVNPSNGETWIKTLCSPDTVFITAAYVPRLSTFCCTFEDVFAFTETYYSNGQSNVTGSEDYYAKDIGLIGYSGYLYIFRINWRATYVKCGSHERGKPWPARESLPGP